MRQCTHVGFLEPTNTNLYHTQRSARPLSELMFGIKAVCIRSHPVRFNEVSGECFDKSSDGK
jgi:hypothetical protein